MSAAAFGLAAPLPHCPVCPLGMHGRGCAAPRRLPPLSSPLRRDCDRHTSDCVGRRASAVQPPTLRWRSASLVASGRREDTVRTASAAHWDAPPGRRSHTRPCHHILVHPPPPAPRDRVVKYYHRDRYNSAWVAWSMCGGIAAATGPHPTPPTGPAGLWSSGWCWPFFNHFPPRSFCLQ